VNRLIPLPLRSLSPFPLITLLIIGLFFLIFTYAYPIYALLFILICLTGLLGLINPELLLWLGLVFVAISPQYITLSQPLGIEMSSFHKLILLFMLFPYLLKYGFRNLFNPIIIAYLIVLGMTFIFSSPPPHLGIVQPFKSFLGLTLGWFFYSIKWKSKFANKYIHSIAFLPLISVAVGILLHIGGVRQFFAYEFTGAFRLQGANIAAHLAMLAFMGTAAALGEVARGNKKWLWLGLINFGILVATGTRGATLAALILFLPYGIQQFKRLMLGRIAKHILVILILAAVVVGLALPNFITRFQGSMVEVGFNTSGRLAAWDFFLDEAEQNPLFGRGLGAGTVLNQGQVHAAFRVPHNEYIRTYVDGGVVGSFVVLIGFGIVLFRIVKVSRRSFRLFMMMFLAGFLVYSFFDNTLSTTQFSIPFGWYLGVIYTQEAMEKRKRVALLVETTGA
jgi:teichuronic acid biosynthesis protein TuaE